MFMAIGCISVMPVTVTVVLQVRLTVLSVALALCSFL